MMFVEAMEAFQDSELEESFERFEKAAIRGHEESQWIWDLLKDMELKWENKEAIEKAFAETESPLGYYLAGELYDWDSRERFEYMKKSSDGGCIWGQSWYADYFDPREEDVHFVEKDEETYLELLEKAAAWNNPRALCRRASYKNEDNGNIAEALLYYCRAAQLGWQEAKIDLSQLFYDGDGVEKDLVQAVHWDSETNEVTFWKALMDAKNAWNDKALDGLGCDFSRLAMEIGKGLYWYQYKAENWEVEAETAEGWEDEEEKPKEFVVKLLNYYCKTIELQQGAIFLFLLFWNKTTGVKGPGQIIGQMVWEGRYDCLVKRFGEDESEEKRGVKR